MSERPPEPSIALQTLELLLHEALRELEETWQAEDDGRVAGEVDNGWTGERERIRRSARQVVLFALVSQAVTQEDVSMLARSFQGMGLSDPLAEELQSPGLAAIADELAERASGAGPHIGGTF